MFKIKLEQSHLTKNGLIVTGNTEKVIVTINPSYDGSGELLYIKTTDNENPKQSIMGRFELSSLYTSDSGKTISVYLTYNGFDLNAEEVNFFRQDVPHPEGGMRIGMNYAWDYSIPHIMLYKHVMITKSVDSVTIVGSNSIEKPIKNMDVEVHGGIQHTISYSNIRGYDIKRIWIQVNPEIFYIQQRIWNKMLSWAEYPAYVTLFNELGIKYDSDTCDYYMLDKYGLITFISEEFNPNWVKVYDEGDQKVQTCTIQKSLKETLTFQWKGEGDGIITRIYDEEEE